MAISATTNQFHVYTAKENGKAANSGGVGGSQHLMFMERLAKANQSIGAGATAQGGGNIGNLQDTAELSPDAQKLSDALATTARRDNSLAKLAEGPVVLGGEEISQRDGFKHVSDASWNRYIEAFTNLPDEAKAKVKEQLTVTQSEWVNTYGAKNINEAPPEMQQELQWTWQAQAAFRYANSAEAQGSPADLANMAGGARQYLQAREGYLAHGGKWGE